MNVNGSRCAVWHGLTPAQLVLSPASHFSAGMVATAKSAALDKEQAPLDDEPSAGQHNKSDDTGVPLHLCHEAPHCSQCDVSWRLVTPSEKLIASKSVPTVTNDARMKCCTGSMRLSRTLTSLAIARLSNTEAMQHSTT